MNTKDAKDRRRMRVNISCSQEEYTAIHSLCSKSMSQSVNEYARKVLLEKPVVMVWRNVSIDALIEELNELRNKLEPLMIQRHELAEMVIMKNILDTVRLIADKITEQCIPKQN